MAGILVGASRLAVLVSGTGTILEAIIDKPISVELVVSDRPCNAITVAARHRIPTLTIDRRDFGYAASRAWDRRGFTLEAVRQLEKYEIDLVAMAGFMTILGPEIFENFQDRILNTHPSLLPKFKGATAVLDALGSGDTQTGCTIHIATTKLDAGRILAQARVPILPGDTPELLHERIKQSERTLYPEAILVCMARRKRN